MGQIGLAFVNPAPLTKPNHVVNFAKRCEEMGLHSLWTIDRIAYDNLEPLTLLASAAAVTQKLRLGTSVLLGNTRHPSHLAKIIATIDFISNGRVTLGIGFGSRESDYKAVEIPFEKRGSRAVEQIQLIKRLWTEEHVSHQGAHYRVHDATVLPRPIQRPHPPVMIGGGGPRILRIAAREAQIVSLLPPVDARGRRHIRSMTLASVSEGVARLRRAKRFAELELNVIVTDAQVTDARQPLLAAVAAHLKSAVTAIVATPFFLYGSRRSLVEDLLERRERLGISYVALPARAMRSFAPIVAELRGR